MPLEIVYPTDLLAKVLALTQPAVVVTKSLYERRLPLEQARFVMHGEWETELKSNLENAPATAASNVPETDSDTRAPHPDDLAYVVMSSGTTGTPKGIACPHRGAVHSYYYRYVNFPYDEGEREACNVFFVWEVLRPLLRGATAYVIPDDQIYDPLAVLEYVNAHAITRMLFTPSLWQLVLDTVLASEQSRIRLAPKLKSLKIIWLCGEVVTMELRNRSITTFPDCRFLNLYSVSECHDVAIQDLARLTDCTTTQYAPCGQVFENVQCFVLDPETLKPVPLTQPGELYVTGPVLARGYVRDAEKTAQRFVRNHLLDWEHASEEDKFTYGRMYRTGDVARFLFDGTLELMGRCDFMVKIRGYSVNVGAIEAALSECDGISTACVLTEGKEGESKRLVAYLVPEEWGALPPLSTIIAFLKTKLPHYAVPAIFMAMKALPIHAATGKLDRSKLPPSAQMPKIQHTAKHTEGEQLTTTEGTLRTIWASLLELEDEAVIQSGDSFFDLGGHSLLITRLTEEISRTFESILTVPEVVEHPSLRDMAHLIDQRSKQSTLEDSKPSLNLREFLSREVVLEESLHPAPTRKHGYSHVRVESFRRAPHRVLLTGATGYFGAFLLHALLRTNTHTVVYCLVRGSTEEEAQNRVTASLEKYSLLTKSKRSTETSQKESTFVTPREEPRNAPLSEEELEERVVVVRGDLTKPLLGLTNDVFKALAGEIDLILHNGAEVNLIKSYDSLRTANVLGTHEVLRLAVTNGLLSSKVKPVVYVSTNAVFGSHNKKCLETDPLSDPSELADGYSQSKWVSEKLCVEAESRGLPVSILRPGNLAACGAVGDLSPALAYNHSDFIVLLLSACKRLGAVPSDVDWHFDLTPVDWAAAAVAHLVAKATFRIIGQRMHVQTPHPHLPASLVFSRLASVLEPNRLESVPYKEWRERLRTQAAAGSDDSLTRVNVAIDSFAPYLTTPPVFDSRDFCDAVAEDGTLVCPQFDHTSLDSWLQVL
eukprot:c19805_g1_i3.p1 GENE.c19805_g1_i3~~c19805_g1_i3.p1  ORF type:complete len:996 (+),score=223.78 c19805_g1_i3:677-3664(+)